MSKVLQNTFMAVAELVSVHWIQTGKETILPI
jgi:hypothetical protein